MRRASDVQHGERTGGGRRARDRILTGETRPSPVLSGRRELEHLVLFLGDDLRESALAVGGIEAFLLRAQQLLEQPDLSAEDLRALVEDEQVVHRIDLLTDALSSLRRSMDRIHLALKSSTGNG